VSEWLVRTRAETQGRGDGDASGDTAALDDFVIEDSLGYLVNRVARSIANQLAEEIRPAGVAIGQWAVLLFLWARDGMSQADLSRVVAIEPPTMVRTIDRMVRDGLVTRIADPSDGRVSRIHLTERGRSLRDELIPKAVAVNAATLGPLSPSEARTLRRLLVKLLEGSAIST
jgi:DNA-binding MarR family transcriptional regulator